MHNRPAGNGEQHGPEMRPAARPPQGETRPAQGPVQAPQPRLPHERDESADSQQAGEPAGRRIGQIAHDDLERGLVDTDQGPVLDATYERTRSTSDHPDTRFRR